MIIRYLESSSYLEWNVLIELYFLFSLIVVVDRRNHNHQILGLKLPPMTFHFFPSKTDRIVATLPSLTCNKRACFNQLFSLRSSSGNQGVGMQNFHGCKKSNKERIGCSQISNKHIIFYRILHTTLHSAMGFLFFTLFKRSHFFSVVKRTPQHFCPSISDIFPLHFQLCNEPRRILHIRFLLFQLYICYYNYY